MGKQSELRERVIERAETHLGYRARPNRDSVFGRKTGYNGQEWSGSFIEFVLIEERLTAGVAFVSTTAALSYFIREGQTVSTPKRGDIVFFAFSTDNPLSQMHVGLVTDASKWRSTNSFRTIEGQVSPGTARGHDEEDGVYVRTRYGTDVLSFVRPRYRPRPAPAEQQLSKVSEVQTALASLVGARGMVKGKRDGQTRSALRRFQLETGDLQGTGEMDDPTIGNLTATMLQ